jgi:hypothetical protein
MPPDKHQYMQRIKQLMWPEPLTPDFIMWLSQQTVEELIQAEATFMQMFGERVTDSQSLQPKSAI